jgi:hypothetical protein
VRQALLGNRTYIPAPSQEPSGSLSSATPTDDRPASRHSQVYQGWAPGTSDSEADDPRLTSSESRDPASGESSADGQRASPTEPLLRDLPPLRRRAGEDLQAQEWEQSRFAEGREAEPTVTESALRTTALLQSVRRHARFSPQSTSHMEDYILERERAAARNEGRERAQVARASMPPRMDSDDDIGPRVHALQRARRLSDFPHSNSSPWLEEAIRYLERLRSCDTDMERLSSAAESGFVRDEFLSPAHEDFILDTRLVRPPAPI